MSVSYSLTGTITFTATHAKHMAAKVATDLKRIQRLYGYPHDIDIANFEAEVIEFLKEGYLDTVTYGFRRGENWIEPTLRYTSRDLANMAVNDDDPGRVRPGADTHGASFYSYLTHSQVWDALPESERNSFIKRLPFQRNGAPEPGINGHLRDDRTYSSGGRALSRASVRSLV